MNNNKKFNKNNNLNKYKINRRKIKKNIKNENYIQIFFYFISFKTKIFKKIKQN